MLMVVVWVVLMILWLVFGCRACSSPQGYPGVLLPWACVLILGLAVFGLGPVVVAR